MFPVVNTTGAVGPPPHTHTFLGYVKRSAHPPVLFSLSFVFMNPQKGRTHLTCLTGMAPPAPALPKASQHTLYNAPASSSPSRARAGFDLLPGFQLIIVYLGREYSKQEVLMFLFAYVKNEDFHMKDRNRVAFGPLPKSYSIFPAALCPQMKK